MGVDPGATAGICIFDLQGNLLHCESGKGGLNWVISRISGFGKPIVVATDVNPPPSAVEKLASTFGAKLVFPKENMHVRQKENIAKKYGIRKDKHKRDALAAAYLAVSTIIPRLREIERKMRERGISFDESVMERYVLGKPLLGTKTEDKVKKRAKVRKKKDKAENPKKSVKKQNTCELREKAPTEKPFWYVFELEISALKEEIKRLKRIIKGLYTGEFVFEEGNGHNRECVYCGDGFIVTKKREKSLRQIINEYYEERRKELKEAVFKHLQ